MLLLFLQMEMYDLIGCCDQRWHFILSTSFIAKANFQMLEAIRFKSSITQSILKVLCYSRILQGDGKWVPLTDHHMESALKEMIPMGKRTSPDWA